MSSRLAQLANYGQSVWLDFISRELVQSGRLAEMIRDDNVTGLTSNPTIFEKAIRHGDAYDEDIRSAIARNVRAAEELFLEIATADIKSAAHALFPVHEATGGRDGFASLEVSPALSHDTSGTIAMARELWKRVDAPNLMIKVPATPEGIPAIQELIASGINVNVTLIFSLAAYRAVTDAYITGLEQRQRKGLGLDVHSVASFFVSRIDTAVDKLLEASSDNTAASALMGKAAIANARLAYNAFQEVFENGERFAKLRKAGAHVQRPLWASTSAKNPKYRDVVYAEALIAPNTVDTMPPETIEAFLDHGIAEESTATRDIEDARHTLEGLAGLGIDFAQVTANLLAAGIDSFAASYISLLEAIADKVDAAGPRFSARQSIQAGASARALEDATRSINTLIATRKLWARDPSLWTTDAAASRVITNRLGWLDVAAEMQDHQHRLSAMADSARRAGYTDCLLLGMGGSSLCPEVFASVFATKDGFLNLHVLDTTDPASILAMEKKLSLEKTLFVVSSKSGGTVETLSHFAYFWDKVSSLNKQPGDQFIAVTDGGSPLAALAADHDFRDIFANPSDIGGRYSALSFFGLVPASLMGMDVPQLLEKAREMQVACMAGNPGAYNPGFALGTALGILYRSGRDKVTIITSPRLASFGLWAEQLIAESTGKEGKGLVPVAGEQLGAPDKYGEDRVFISIELDERSEAGAQLDALSSAGHPVIRLRLRDSYDLGAEFFRWEFATAIAATHLGIDPFDEPNVQESKDNTRKLLLQYEKEGKISPTDATPTHKNPEAVARAIEEFLENASPPQYVALMAYVAPTSKSERALAELQVAVRDRWHTATTTGFGPRFLHSTGQLHKGGPPTGLYIQFTQKDTADVVIPGQKFSFSVLKEAQSTGDLTALRDHGRQALHIVLGPDPEQELEHIPQELERIPVAH